MEFLFFFSSCMMAKKKKKSYLHALFRGITPTYSADKTIPFDSHMEGARLWQISNRREAFSFQDRTAYTVSCSARLGLRECQAPRVLSPSPATFAFPHSYRSLDCAWRPVHVAFAFCLSTFCFYSHIYLYALAAPKVFVFSRTSVLL